MTTQNFDTFRNTTEVLAGFSSLYHDGSAITLGDEPKLVPNMNFAGNWTIEFFVKLSTSSNMCLLSIPDGTGNRYFDVYVEGDKIKTYYEGVEDVLTYTTDPTPLTDWFHVAVCYNTGANTLYTAGTNSYFVANNGATINRVVTNDLSVADSTEISLFRPVHAEADYFNGYVGNVRVRNNFYNYRLETYTLYSSSVNGWQVSSDYPIAGVDEIILQASQVTGSTGGPAKQYHSWAYYNKVSALCTSADSWGGRITKRLHIATQDSYALQIAWGAIASRGTHYFQQSKFLLSVNGDNGNVIRVDTINNTSSTINNGGAVQVWKRGPRRSVLFRMEGRSRRVYESDLPDERRRDERDYH